VNINLHIEHLLISGLPISREQRPELKAVVEADLTLLLLKDGLVHKVSGGTFYRLFTDSIEVSHDISLAKLGAQIASSLHGVINK